MADELARIFQDGAVVLPAAVRDDLAYRHMVALADLFDGWALDRKLTPEQSVLILGWAESMRMTADVVGPEWNPPEPENLSLLAFIARKATEEI